MKLLTGSRITILIMIFLFLVPSSVLFAQRGRRQPPPRAQAARRQPQVQANQEVLYLTEQQERDVIDYLSDVRPEQVDDLLNLKDRRPLAYQRFLSRAFREMRYMEELQQNDPERYEIMAQEKQLESESRDLAKQYRNSTDEDERSRIRAEMRTILDRLFDLRQMNREFEIERLEKRLEEAKANNLRRLENKNSIINARMNELLKEGGMEW